VTDVGGYTKATALRSVFLWNNFEQPYS